jgi:hypothetical protein
MHVRKEAEHGLISRCSVLGSVVRIPAQYLHSPRLSLNWEEVEAWFDVEESR